MNQPCPQRTPPDPFLLVLQTPVGTGPGDVGGWEGGRERLDSLSNWDY